MSLWDLRIIGGIPAHGAYYEEVIASVRKFLPVGHGDNNIFLTYSFLFYVFHRLRQDVHKIVQLPASE